MVVVALAAASSAGVAFAMMRSTFLAVKVLITVVHRPASPATWVSIFTVLPAFSASAVSASVKPWVAWSRAS